MSSYEEYIQQGLGGEAPLKVILCGNVEEAEKDKIGVVSVVYATEKKEWAEQKIRELTKAHPERYYMVSSVTLDVDLIELSHYPSIAISREDLE